MGEAHGRASASYAPGSWVCVAGREVVLFAELDPTGAIVTACWDAAEQGADLDTLLGVILREGLRSVPSFALVARDPAAPRVLVSGKARAEVVIAGEPVAVLSAAGAPTWLERRFDAAESVHLVADGGDGVDGVDVSLPLTAGVVLASAVTVGEPRSAEPATEMAPTEMAATASTAAMPAMPSADGDTAVPSFDHLFGATDSPPPRVEVPPTEVPPTEAPATEVPATEPPAAVAEQPVDEPVSASSDTMHPRPQEDSGLIESLPWVLPDAFRAPAPEGPPPEGPPPEGPPPEGPPPEGPPPEALAPPALPPGSPPPQGPRPVPAEPVTHHTVDRAELLNQPRVAPTVLAVACPNRHLGPPYAGICRVCGAQIPQQDPFSVPRPVLGVLDISTGDMVPLDRDVVLGRAPSATDADPQARPHLVQLASPGNDISRNHVRVGLEGWHVLVTDLGSTNGTVVTLPSQQPVRLRPHDAFTIVPGTVVSIADEVYVRFEVSG